MNVASIMKSVTRLDVTVDMRPSRVSDRSRSAGCRRGPPPSTLRVHIDILLSRPIHAATAYTPCTCKLGEARADLPLAL
eukprot:31227-Eustigmatos_ZCMA.PRE.1